MKEIKCEVIQDLMTLYVDDLTSRESKLLIEEHIKTCGECREILHSMNSLENEIIEATEEVKIEGNIEENELIKKIKKNKFHWSLAVIILMATVGSLLTQDNLIFNGFLVFPAIGAVSYLLVRKHFVGPLAVYGINIIVTTAYAIGSLIQLKDKGQIGEIGINLILGEMMNPITMGIIFAFLVFVGGVVGLLIEKIFLEE